MRDLLLQRIGIPTLESSRAATIESGAESLSFSVYMVSICIVSEEEEVTRKRNNFAELDRQRWPQLRTKPKLPLRPRRPRQHHPPWKKGHQPQCPRRSSPRQKWRLYPQQPWQRERPRRQPQWPLENLLQYQQQLERPLSQPQNRGRPRLQGLP